MKIIKSLLLLECLFASSLEAASIQIGLSIQFNTLNDIGGNPLAAGTANDGDGAVLQLGYYTMSTTENPFAGNWVAMTGPGTTHQTTIGDSGDRGTGSFKTDVLFVQGSYFFPEPAVGTLLALRFYNSTSLGSSTYFNAVSVTSGGFSWVAPTDPMATANLGLTFLTAGVKWQDGSTSAYRTTIPIPEPSSAMVLASTTGLLAFRRRRLSDTHPQGRGQ
jgi:hypothetical protein